MNNREISKLIKEKRKEKKMTQQDLADKLCVSNNVISKWENEVTIPPLDLLIPLCKYLDIDINQIFKDEESVNNLLLERKRFAKKLNNATIVFTVINIILYTLIGFVFDKNNFSIGASLLVFCLITLIVVNFIIYFIYVIKDRIKKI